MPNLIATIPHGLSRAEAKRRLQEQIGILNNQQGAVFANLQERWTGDVMDFSANALGQTVSGRLTIEDHLVRVEMALPWLLGLIAGTVKHRIEQQVTHTLASGPAKPMTS